MVANEGGRQIYWLQMILSVVNLSCNDYKGYIIVAEILTKITKVIMMMIINDWSWLMKANILAPDHPLSC